MTTYPDDDEVLIKPLRVKATPPVETDRRPRREHVERLRASGPRVLARRSPATATGARKSRTSPTPDWSH